MNKLHLTLTGIVEKISNSTARVKVARIKRHPIYLKKYTVHKMYLAAIPAELKVEVGDTVNIVSQRKTSKNKAWRISAK